MPRSHIKKPQSTSLRFNVFMPLTFDFQLSIFDFFSADAHVLSSAL